MLFNNLFNRSIEEQKPLSLMRSSSDDFWFGIVADYNEEAVEIRLFDVYGDFDGYAITDLDDIKSIEYDDEYEMVTAYLITENSFMTHIPDSKVTLVPSNWRYSALSALLALKIPVDLSIEGKSRMGYLEQVDFEAFEIQLFDSFGDARGRLFCKIEDVEHIRYFSRKIKKSALLYEWRAKDKK